MGQATVSSSSLFIAVLKLAMSLYLYLYICCVFSIKAHSLIQHRCRIATYMTAMKDVTLETTVMEKIRVTPFGHMLIFQPMVVNSFQLDNLCGRYVSNYTFKLKKKMIRLTVEDVGIFLSIPYVGTPVDLSRQSQASNDTPLWRKYFQKKRTTMGRPGTAISW